VMFYCSLCGCAATSHEVSKEWKSEERKKQQESSKRRDRERAQRQREQQQQQQANTVKLKKKEIGAYKVRPSDLTVAWVMRDCESTWETESCSGQLSAGYKLDRHKAVLMQPKLRSLSARFHTWLEPRVLSSFGWYPPILCEQSGSWPRRKQREWTAEMTGCIGMRGDGGAV
jgi:hypothetical protein